MPHPCPHHCPKGGGGLGALAVLAAVVVIAAIARPVVHAAVDVLEVLAIAVTVVIALGAIAATAYVAVRARRWHATRHQAIPRQGQPSQAVTRPHRPAIGAPRKVIPLTVITGNRIKEEK